jgi:antitoxin VapB
MQSISERTGVPLMGCARAYLLVHEAQSMPYTNVYATPLGGKMQKTARVFMNNRSQAVRLPKEFQFSTKEVFIRRQGDEVILSARPQDWSTYLDGPTAASAEFMEGIEDLPVQEREL